MSETAERKTPLYETHLAYKGKMVPFAGYILPVQYETGVVKEHMAVRTACGGISLLAILQKIQFSISKIGRAHV